MQPQFEPSFDILIVGAGAAGLAAGIFAAEAAHASAQTRGIRIAILDGAKKPGAKILVSGGGRCNVTNVRVTPDDYNGGPRPSIRNVLSAFDENHTREWFREMGVEFYLEPDTGKFFPTTDSAKTILAALLGRNEALGVRVIAGTRVIGIEPGTECVRIATRDLAGHESGFTARKLIVATGGLALPKSGSDGWGLDEMRRLGHTIVPLTPALVPLVLAPGIGVGGYFAEFAGITFDCRLSVSDATGKKLKLPTADRVDALLFTHFGISGPIAMDISRHWLRQRLEHPAIAFTIDIGHRDFDTTEQADTWLLRAVESHPKRDVATALRELYPDRFAKAMAAEVADASGDGALPMAALTKAQRKRLAAMIVRLPLPILRDRGYSFAETSAGGVSMREVDVRTMASRKLPNVFFCGEMLDVDGRIGGFNFQWAWATGFLAGRAAIAALQSPT